MFSEVGKAPSNYVPDLVLEFSAALGTFECDQGHGHDFAAKESHCRTPHFRLVRLASEGEV